MNNRRGWVKNAIIVFLVIMLILTFFSNTIMNASLPEVAAQYSQSGSITSKIRTSASAQANQKHKITIDESREILAVPVKEGDEVQIGDVLFYLVDAESSQLKGAREQLAALEKQYTLTQLTSKKDYYSDELAIRNAEKELAKAKELLESIGSVAEKVDALNAEIKQLNADKKELNKQIEVYNEQIALLNQVAAGPSIDGIPTAERIANATVRLGSAKNALTAAEAAKTATEKALKLAEAEYEKASEAFEALDPDSAGNATSISKQISELTKQMRREKEDHELELAKFAKELEDAYNAWVDADYKYNNALWLGATADVLQRYDAEREAAHAAYEALKEAQKEPIDALKRAYNRRLEDDTEHLNELEASLDMIEGSAATREALDEATKKKTEASEASAKAEKTLADAKTEHTEATAELKSLEKLELLEGCEAKVEELEAMGETINDSISTKQELLSEYSGKPIDPAAQQEIIESLTQDLTTMRYNLNKRREEDKLAAQREQLEIDELLEDIAEQKELIAKYEANSVDAKITASVAGQVNSISAVQGSDTSVGQTLCEIVVTELGYSCEVTLSADQARRVRVGDSVSVSNNWWSRIEGQIVALKNDPKNPGAAKIATIALTGDVTVGQSLNLTIGEKGQNYDTIVPNSAVREDNNGKFVLAVEAKSSPLGNRYIAKRIDVDVLASDETNTAVQGLMGGEFIITTSTSPISAGMQVRMANS